MSSASGEMPPKDARDAFGAECACPPTLKGLHPVFMSEELMRMLGRHWYFRSQGAADTIHTAIAVPPFLWAAEGDQ